MDISANYNYWIAGVSGNLKVFETYVDSSSFSSRQVFAYFENGDWIETGWINATALAVCGPSGGKDKSWIGIYDAYEDFYSCSYEGEVSPGTWHRYKTYKDGNYWKIDIDDDFKKQWYEPRTAKVWAQGEVSDSDNEMSGWFKELKRDYGGWYLWEALDPSADPPYWIYKESEWEFRTDGPSWPPL